MFLLLILLFVWSKWKQPVSSNDGTPEKNNAIDRAANGILGNLSLLFVPAAVGIIQHLPLIANHTVALTLTILGSTLLTLLVSVGIFRLLSAKSERS